jgi:hypothetical protein
VKLAAPGIAPGIALGEWRRLPPAGSLAVKGAALWRLYDGAFKSVASGHSDGSTRWANEGGAQSWLVVYPASTEGATVEIGD